MDQPSRDREGAVECINRAATVRERLRPQKAI